MSLFSISISQMLHRKCLCQNIIYLSELFIWNSSLAGHPTFSPKSGTCLNIILLVSFSAVNENLTLILWDSMSPWCFFGGIRTSTSSRWLPKSSWGRGSPGAVLTLHLPEGLKRKHWRCFSNVYFELEYSFFTLYLIRFWSMWLRGEDRVRRELF